jgi:hypothetical protein
MNSEEIMVTTYGLDTTKTGNALQANSIITRTARAVKSVLRGLAARHSAEASANGKPALRIEARRGTRPTSIKVSRNSYFATSGLTGRDY